MIFDAAGSKVFEKRLSDKNNQLQIKLPAGTYFYQLKNKDGKQKGGKLISKP